MDSYGSHIKEEVSNCPLQLLRKSIGDSSENPPVTSILQPLDVSLNSSFKAALHRGWLDRLLSSPKKMTSKGDRQQPSYQAVVDMMLKAVYSLLLESIRKIFLECVELQQMEKKSLRMN